MPKLGARKKSRALVADDAVEAKVSWRSRIPAVSAGDVVVIVVDADQTRTVPSLVELFPAADLHVVFPGPDVPRPDVPGVTWHSAPGNDSLARLLESIGTMDVFVYLRRVRVEAALATWGRSYLHVADGGTLILASINGTGPAALKALERLATIRDGEIDGLFREETEAARSTSEMTSTPDGIVFTKRGSHQLKVGEARADEVLPIRLPGVTVNELSRLPAVAFTARNGAVVSHRSTSGQPVLPAEYSVPALPLRQYEAAVTLGASLLSVIGHTLLPGSFRSPFKKEVIPESGRNPTPTFAVVDPMTPRRLPGVYYDLRATSPERIGSVMTDTVGKLWGWDEAKRRLPELKAIYRLPAGADPDGIESEILTAWGIDPVDVEWVHDDVEVEGLVSATTMWQQDYPHYAHPELRDVWSRIRTALGPPVDPKAPAKVFITRGRELDERRCRNADEVEQHFAASGFTVVDPASMTLAERTAVLGRAEVVAGFAGVGLFDVALAADPRAVVILGQESYPAKEEQMFGLLSGAEVHVFWSAADKPRAEGKYDPEAMQSAWEFDFARNRGDLDQLLSTL